MHTASLLIVAVVLIVVLRESRGTGNGRWQQNGPG